MIKLLHLYHDLMNLYGEWANAAILARALNYCGIEATVIKKSIGDTVEFDTYDLIYIGSGTERNQYACMRELAQYKEAIRYCIDEGIYFLATGNAHELFGQKITASSGESYDTLGILGFETTQDRSRVTGDVVVTASFMPGKFIGFINRAGGRQNILDKENMFERPFTVEIKSGSKLKKKGRPLLEGIKHRNLLGTYMTGPLLVRNPPLLEYFANSLAVKTGYTRNQGEPAANNKDSILFGYQQKAYAGALQKLTEETR